MKPYVGACRGGRVKTAALAGVMPDHSRATPCSRTILPPVSTSPRTPMLPLVVGFNCIRICNAPAHTNMTAWLRVNVWCRAYAWLGVPTSRRIQQRRLATARTARVLRLAV